MAICPLIDQLAVLDELVPKAPVPPAETPPSHLASRRARLHDEAVIQLARNNASGWQVQDSNKITQFPLDFSRPQTVSADRAETQR
jgi:hypothetical protein